MLMAACICSCIRM
uniref:Uncharacterized protein n=1 Tax=Arundo donax TaxID=35708 RepID=A0A0A8YVC9_ARUDO